MLKIDQMLADFAQVHERKLFISGAGINILTATPDAEIFLVRFYLALTIRAAHEDEGQHRFRISILDPSGNNVTIMENQGPGIDAENEGKLTGTFSLGSSPDTRTDQETVTPTVFGFNPLRIPQLGLYQLITEIGPVTSSVQFDVVGPPGRVPDELTRRAPKPMKITGRITAVDSAGGVKFTGPGAFDLRDLQITAIGNDVGIEVENAEIQDYDTIIE